MTHVATLISGYGFGPEGARATRTIPDAAGAGVEWEEGSVPGTIGLLEGDPRPSDPAVTSLLRTRAGLIGPLTTPLGAGIEAIIEELT